MRARRKKLGPKYKPRQYLVGALALQIGFTPLANAIASCFPNREALSKVLRESINYSGTDTRINVDSTRYPYDAIGKLTKEGQDPADGCEGFLTLNPQILVTVAHCVLENQKIISKSLKFYAGYSNGDYRQAVRAKVYSVGSTNTPRDAHLDCAVILLEEPIYNTRPFALTKPDFNPASTSVAFELPGYSFDKNGGGKSLTTAKGRLEELMAAGTYSHHIPMRKGASGGPIFYKQPGAADAVVVAMQSQEMTLSEKNQGEVASYKNRNFAVPVSCFHGKVYELLEKIKPGAVSK